MAKAKRRNMKKAALDDGPGTLSGFAKRYLRPHLWVKTSRPKPESVYMAVRDGEADFRQVPLPEGLVSGKSVVNKEALVQVMRDHYQQYEVSPKQFGEIISYTLKFSYDEPGIEFTPDGTMISLELLGDERGERDTSEEDLAVAQFIDTLVQSMDISIKINWDDVEFNQKDLDLNFDDEEILGD